MEAPVGSSILGNLPPRRRGFAAALVEALSERVRAGDPGIPADLLDPLPGHPLARGDPGVALARRRAATIRTLLSGSQWRETALTPRRRRSSPRLPRAETMDVPDPGGYR